MRRIREATNSPRGAGGGVRHEAEHATPSAVVSTKARRASHNSRKS